MSAAPNAGADGAPLAASVFNRTRIMTALAVALGLPARRPCCADEAALPPARENLGNAAATVLPAAAQIFGQHCAPCHETPEPSPPNFLYGDAARVNAALVSCAPRIFVRLGMWAMKPQARLKTPMPPPLASRDGSPIDHETAPDAATLGALRAAASELLRAEPEAVTTLDALIARGYETLHPCLPAGR
jgi:cytochrome c5